MSVITPLLPRLLDDAVESAQHIDVAGHHLHPWLLFVDIGMVAVCLLAYIFAAVFGGLVLSKFLLLFALVYFCYEQGFLKFKLRILKTQSRSYLQDGLMFFFPAFLFGAWAMGMSVPASADFLGLMLPLWCGFVRIGCFLGGCCFGVPWKYGVLYSDRLYRDPTGCRRHTANPLSGCRVLPIQLVESLINFSLFAALFARLYMTRDLAGETLPLYLICYCCYRIISDVFRRASARPRHGPFSEAQLVSFFVILTSLIYLRAW